MSTYFVAIPVPISVATPLLALAPEAPGVRVSAAADLHLTLAFLGG